MEPHSCQKLGYTVVLKCNQIKKKSSNIEDEDHFILECSFYLELKQKLIKKFQFYKPSIFKLVLIINNVKELCRLGKFSQQATIHRNERLSII